MKQIFQSLNDGEIILKELPLQSCPPGNVLIKNHCSLLSKGTEKMLLDFGKANIIGKIKQQPDKVQQTLDKIKNDGLLSTITSIKSKLNEPIALGYSSMGEIIYCGKDVKNYKIGDRVISNGPHAEVVSIPYNLCALVPKEVSDEEASFTVISSIGLQALRLSEPTLGETFLVIGLGLIGLITCQLLKANGCKVIGVDVDPNKRKIAELLGIKFYHNTSEEVLVNWCMNETSGIGVDGVIISASTKSNAPIELAAKVSRKKGRIVLLGVTGLNLRRDLFYKKELTFKVSCSYGPGRYENLYEEKGLDYPFAYVRWTEQRNFQSILELLKSKKLNVNDLITHTYDIKDASQAYQIISENKPTLGIIIKYPYKKILLSKEINLNKNKISGKNYDQVNLGFIGVGNYARKVLIPSFKKAGGNFLIAASNTGINSLSIANKYSFEKITTNVEDLINNKECDTIVISTRHDSHAELIAKCLKAEKNIFVEKPLCLTYKELDLIKSAYTNKSLLMVGFNRRFAPLVKELKKLLINLPDEKCFIYTINAGFIDPNHWTQDKNIGGGRLIGEACHFVDLLRHLSNSKIEEFNYINMKDSKPCPDNFSLQLKFENGSIGVINYLSNGSKAFPKERIEVFSGNSIICFNNFRKIETWGIKNFKTRRTFSQNKGQLKCTENFIKAIKKGDPSPIPIEEIFEVQEILLSIKN